MVILHVIPSLDPKGGGPMDCLIRMAEEHSNSGHRVEAVCFDDADAMYLQGLPLQAHGLGPGVTAYAYNNRLIPWLKKNLVRFDVVVIHGLWMYHSYGAWRILHKSSIPYVVYVHGMLDPWFKRTYPLKHLKKWLLWPWTDYRVLRDAKAVLFTCEEERVLASKSFGLYKANEVVVKFGAATPPQNAEQLKDDFLLSYPDLRGKRLLLFLSRIHKKKGCDLLIDAYAKVCHLDPSVQLVMAGPDQTGWVVKLKEQADKLGISDRISWVGMLHGDKKWGAFYASEVFVLPSHQENFGIAVAESLGCGLPVLISNKVNIWREIEADGAGFVGNDDVIDTDRNLRNWLEMDIELCSGMKTQARRTFHERYTTEQMANSLINLVEGFVNDCKR